MEDKDSRGKKFKWFIVAGILEIIFTTLKLCNIVTWSWVWVLSPVWGLVLLLLLLIIFEIGVEITSYIMAVLKHGWR